MTKHLYTRVREHLRKSFRVYRKHLPSDQKRSICMGRRTQPGFKSKVEPFAHSCDSCEHHRQPLACCKSAVCIWIASLGVESVSVLEQLFCRQSLLQESLNCEVGRTK